jgi:hypothetical protein
MACAPTPGHQESSMVRKNVDAHQQPDLQGEKLIAQCGINQLMRR